VLLQLTYVDCGTIGSKAVMAGVSEMTESITGEQEGNADYERLTMGRPHALVLSLVSTPRDEDEVLDCLYITVLD
jgi:hypothetical protein